MAFTKATMPATIPTIAAIANAAIATTIKIAAAKAKVGGQPAYKAALYAH
jgi:hypothetical protein